MRSILLRGTDLRDLEKALTPVPGEPLHYRLAGNASVVARPFASFGPEQRYFVFLDRSMGRRIPHQEMKFTGRWNNAGVFRFSNEVGAIAEGQFEGTGVRWLGRRFDDAGTAEVSIDDRVVATVDQYGPGRDLSFDWPHRGLASAATRSASGSSPRSPEPLPTDSSTWPGSRYSPRQDRDPDRCL